MKRETTENVGGFRHQMLLRASTDSDRQNTQCGSLIETVLWSHRGFRTSSAQMILMEKHRSLMLVLLRSGISAYCFKYVLQFCLNFELLTTHLLLTMLHLLKK